MSKKQIEIVINEKGSRLDLLLLSTLTKELPSSYSNMLSRSLIGSIISNNVLVNGKVEKKGKKLKIGDRVVVQLDGVIKELDQGIDLKTSLEPEDGKLEIVEENREWMVIKKPKGLVVHPGVGNYSGTLANIVKGYLVKKGEYDYRVQRGGIVHRLDKGVSGLMIIAKTYEEQKYLKKQFETHKVVKIYRASVQKKDSATSDTFKGVDDFKTALTKLEKNDFKIDSSWIKVEGYVGRSRGNRMQMRMVSLPQPGYKYSLTYIKPLIDTTFLIKIETGRMHQIRAAFLKIGYHIVGDTLYGAVQESEGEGIALEAVALSIEMENGERKYWGM